MVTFAPRALVLVFAPQAFGCGSPKSAREVKPRPYPAQRRDPLWPPLRRRDAIPKPPQVDRRLIEEMRERARKTISAARPQIEAMLASARVMRAAMRTRKTGIPFIPYVPA